MVERFYPDHVEKWLATCIEQPALDGLEQLARAEKPLEKATKLKLSVAYYLAVQLYRTPAALEERWGPAFAQGAQQTEGQAGQGPACRPSGIAPEPSRTRCRESGVRDTDDLRRQAAPRCGDRSREVLAQVQVGRWGSPLKVPAASLQTTRSLRDVCPDGRKYFLFPLASQAILVGVETTDLSRVLDRVEVLEIPAADVRKYNSEMVAAARRYVYASRKEPWVEKVRDKNRRT